LNPSAASKSARNRLVNDTMGGAYLSGFKEAQTLTGMVENVKSSP